MMKTIEMLTKLIKLFTTKMYVDSKSRTPQLSNRDLFVIVI